ncbi:MAG: DUF3500 domain-containing protein [Rhodothermales bacterium]
MRTCRTLPALLIAGVFAVHIAGAQSPDPTSSAVQMTAAAVQLLEALSPEARQTAMFRLDDEVARTTWSNLPASFVARKGVRLGDLDAPTRILLHRLIQASTSSQGYAKMSGIMWLDEILHDQSLERQQRGEMPSNERMNTLIASWTSDNYWFSFFGDPAVDANWAWLLSGHHLSANFTVAEGKVAFTPLFLGAEPYEVASGPMAGWRVLSHEVERGYEMVQSLDAAQRRKAILSDEVPRDIVEGPGGRGDIKAFEGLPASELNANQQLLLWHLVREYVANADFDAADAQMKKIEADGLEKLYFTWIGPSDDIAKRYYYRVHGPSILIEYMRERGVGEGAANHIHTIVRDPNNDYGEDWLKVHYREQHGEGR